MKTLTLKAGKKLSVQNHYNRSEHWIVVGGTVDITVDDLLTMLTENRLPVGRTHRLADRGKIEMELIAAYNGSYLGEDDFTRMSNEFGRKCRGRSSVSLLNRGTQ